ILKCFSQKAVLGGACRAAATWTAPGTISTIGRAGWLASPVRPVTGAMVTAPAPRAPSASEHAAAAAVRAGRAGRIRCFPSARAGAEGPPAPNSVGTGESLDPMARSSADYRQILRPWG